MHVCFLVQRFILWNRMEWQELEVMSSSPPGKRGSKRRKEAFSGVETRVFVAEGFSSPFLCHRIRWFGTKGMRYLRNDDDDASWF